jgi:hypothetical protein
LGRVASDLVDESGHGPVPANGGGVEDCEGVDTGQERALDPSRSSLPGRGNRSGADVTAAGYQIPGDAGLS